MSLVFAANVDDRAQTTAVPYDSLGALSDFDHAIQFRFDGAGTGADSIITKSDRFSLTRIAGTSGDLRFTYRSTAGNIRTVDMLAVAANDWHVLRLRWDGDNQYVYLDGTLVDTNNWTSTSWLDDNTNRYNYGSGNVVVSGMLV